MINNVKIMLYQIIITTRVVIGYSLEGVSHCLNIKDMLIMTWLWFMGCRTDVRDRSRVWEGQSVLHSLFQ